MAAYRYEISHRPLLTREISSSKLKDKFHTYGHPCITLYIYIMFDYFAHYICCSYFSFMLVIILFNQPMMYITILMTL